ncbi:unnamed protein product [Strongylus vulgaris]|uniref:Uncharacterized protein n=1 Tax=Strongylus vulgaris TaxID=40348 RepID=A0A3P7IV21_STRVU|nr:unnamed protein product [Strongylus vulgaris]
MQEKGCVTMFNDDLMHSTRGLFHYPASAFRKGFRVSPTTHYYRPYYLEIYAALLNVPKACLKGDFLHGEFLDIWYRFITTYQDKCHFSFSFLTSLTHDKPNNIQLIDDVLSDRFRLLEVGIFVIVVVEFKERVMLVRVHGRLASILGHDPDS